MSNLLNDAARRASRYLESLDARSVAPTPEAIAALEKFEQPFPEQEATAEAVLAELDQIGSPATMASAGGRFFGFTKRRRIRHLRDDREFHGAGCRETRIAGSSRLGCRGAGP